MVNKLDLEELIWWMTDFETILYKLNIMQQMNDKIGNHDGCKIDGVDISKLQLIHRKMSNHLENLENPEKLETASITT